MKMNFKYAVAVLSVISAAGCDDKIEPFERTGLTEAPAAIQTITSEPLPGQIQLNWAAPEGDFTYLQIKYYDPLAQKDVYKIASKGTTEMLIDNTRARFGEYEFSFQTFNALDQSSEAKIFKAISGAAPSTITVVGKSKIALTDDQLSTNAQEPSEGPIKNLIDSNTGSFFHTRWSSPQIDLPHWIQVNLKEPHENFSIYYMNRTDNTWTTAGRPSVVEFQISNDGNNWETITTISGMPTAAGSEYNSDYVSPGKTFTYFRFLVTATSGNTKYFNMAEFAMYDVELDVYDPELEGVN